MRGFIVYDGLPAVNILHADVETSEGKCFLHLLLKRGDAELLPDPPRVDEHVIAIRGIVGLESDLARPIKVRIDHVSIQASLALFWELRPAMFSEIHPDIWRELESEASIQQERHRTKEPMPMLAKFQLFPYAGDDGRLRWFSLADEDGRSGVAIA